MKLKSALLIICFFLFVCLAVSCESQPKNETGSGTKMTPTDEYNYILSQDYWIDQIFQFSSEGLLPGVELDTVREESKKILDAIGYSEPNVNGKTDGERIILEAIYPVTPGFENKAEVISKLANSKAKLPGRIRTENLIGYTKLPGLESVLDAVHDYFDILIENNENPNGKKNPMIQVYGACMMLGINLQNDIFSWMDDEMGLVSFIVEDNNGKKYVSTAFAISINNKNKAMDSLNKLVGIAAETFWGGINPEKILIASTIKSFDLQTINISEINSLNLDLLDNKFDKMTTALLYTNDYIFIGETSEVKQLADIYDPGGAEGEKATVSGYVNIDDFVKYSRRYRDEKAVRKFLEDFVENNPQKNDLLASKLTELEEYLEGKEFGEMKFSKNFTPDGINLKLETTKTSLELLSFWNEWLQSLWDEEEIEVNFSESDSENEKVEI